MENKQNIKNVQTFDHIILYFKNSLKIFQLKERKKPRRMY